ncbi:XRE family transcriptional regulator [Acinetobacter pittii]|uniref:XRE family transcriptional regulator n=1 Tax=Acinetobacter pittii TaxID=48296 RepID=A0A3G6YNQ8_ACIPI|nr:XRE family transcriptional regulator [Acinetobacter pittii]
MFNLYSWWRGLTQEQRKKFCVNANVGYRYMDNHLVHRNKNPSIKTVDSIVRNSNGEITHKGLIEFFLTWNKKSTI